MWKAISIINVMPSGGFPMDVSLGYVAHPFAIESSNGGPNGSRQFIGAAHQRGIAVILDVVCNHFCLSDPDGGLGRFYGWFENRRDGVYSYNGRWERRCRGRAPRGGVGGDTSRG